MAYDIPVTGHGMMILMCHWRFQLVSQALYKSSADVSDASEVEGASVVIVIRTDSLASLIFKIAGRMGLSSGLITLTWGRGRNESFFIRWTNVLKHLK